MSKFRRLRQHAGTTRTVIPTPTSLNPYQETDAEKAASTVHGDNNIAALDRWVHRDGTVIYVIPSLEPDAAETLEQQQKSFFEQLPRFRWKRSWTSIAAKACQRGRPRDARPLCRL